jgi:hypothetical protein
LEKAIPDYIKTIPGYYKKTWFGKKWIPERRHIKNRID